MDKTFYITVSKIMSVIRQKLTLFGPNMLKKKSCHFLVTIECTKSNPNHKISPYVTIAKKYTVGVITM